MELEKMTSTEIESSDAITFAVLNIQEDKEEFKKGFYYTIPAKVEENQTAYWVGPYEDNAAAVSAAQAFIEDALASNLERALITSAGENAMEITDAIVLDVSEAEIDFEDTEETKEEGEDN